MSWLLWLMLGVIVMLALMWLVDFFLEGRKQ